MTVNDIYTLHVVLLQEFLQRSFRGQLFRNILGGLLVKDLTGVSPQIAWDPTESTAKHGNNRVNGHRGKFLAPQLTIQRAKPRSRNDEVRSSE